MRSLRSLRPVAPLPAARAPSSRAHGALSSSGDTKRSRNTSHGPDSFAVEMLVSPRTSPTSQTSIVSVVPSMASDETGSVLQRNSLFQSTLLIYLCSRLIKEHWKRNIVNPCSIRELALIDLSKIHLPVVRRGLAVFVSAVES